MQNTQVHWYVSRFYAIVKHNQLNWRTCVYNGLAARWIARLNTCEVPVRRAIITPVCFICRAWITVGQVDLSEFSYLDQYSTCGLVQPITDLKHVSKSFAIWDYIRDVTKSSASAECTLAEHTLLEKKNDYQCSFLCENHERLLPRINKIVTNVFYFNNEQKKL